MFRLMLYLQIQTITQQRLLGQMEQLQDQLVLSQGMVRRILLLMLYLLQVVSKLSNMKVMKLMTGLTIHHNQVL